MKLENCGRCGLRPRLVGTPVGSDGLNCMNPNWIACPSCGGSEREDCWEATQRRIRTERINAAADRLMVKSWNYGNVTDHSIEIMAKVCISAAQDLIQQQDAAAQVRYKAQGE